MLFPGIEHSDLPGLGPRYSDPEPNALIFLFHSLYSPAKTNQVRVANARNTISTIWLTTDIPHVVNSLKNFPSNLTPTAPPNPSKNILHAKKYPTSLGPKQRGLLMTKRLVTPSRPIVVRVRMATTKTSRSKLFLPTSLCFLKMLTRTFKLLISKKLCFSWVAFSWLSGTRKITQRPHIK